MVLYRPDLRPSKILPYILGALAMKSLGLLSGSVPTLRMVSKSVTEDSCLGRQGHCEEWSAGLETYYPKLLGLTYNAKHWISIYSSRAVECQKSQIR
ncbi:hypothetical protein BDV24DRAFT_126266 [Aspergillus arachidicola]|uniref:Uncharacterized protein n=1 Tax=Aspergillus arachidicola TaxID=656916 RepID=A0A5N6YI48_9EURO|nr:hypothetical protein BDV24DRAFT_126266 [Aspergillus arachidicola]